MTELVGNHVRLRKITASPEALLELTIKTEIDVRALVGRAIEGPRRRLPIAATSRGRVGEQHQFGASILLAARRELASPHVLRVVEHERYEVGELGLGFVSRVLGDSRLRVRAQ